MIKIHNEEACNEAMQLAWKEWHRKSDPELIPEVPTIDFQKGFRYAWMLLELKEAEFDLIVECES